MDIKIDQSTSGKQSPNILGNSNKVSISSKQMLIIKIKYLAGGFIMGVITSLVADYLMRFFCV